MAEAVDVIVFRVIAIVESTQNKQGSRGARPSQHDPCLFHTRKVPWSAPAKVVMGAAVVDGPKVVVEAVVLTEQRKCLLKQKPFAWGQDA